MRIVLLAGLAMMTASAGEVISVQMLAWSEASSPAVVRARAMATRIFAGAGFDLEWCGRAKGCRDWENRVIVTVEAESSGGLPPRAMARALPFERRNVWVSLSRMRQAAQRERQPALLAHILVHEITHLLQGCDHHSREGVMKARWEDADIAAMQMRPLPFTPYDIELITLGLASRRATLAQRQ